MQHTENLEEPVITNVDEAEELKPKFKLTNKQKIAMGLVATTLISAGFGLNRCAATKAPEIKPPTTVENVDSTETETETEKFEAIREEPTPELDIYAENMDTYKQMSVEDFERLPREERFQYAKLQIDLADQSRKYNMFFDIGSENEIKPIEISINNTAQEIVQNRLRIVQVALMQEEESPYGEKPFDVDDAQKVLTMNYYSTDGRIERLKEYSSIKDKILRRDLETGLPLEINDSAETVVEDGVVMTGIDINNGETVQFKDITLQTKSGEVGYFRFVYCEFINYDGEPGANWAVESIYRNYDDLVKKAT